MAPTSCSVCMTDRSGPIEALLHPAGTDDAILASMLTLQLLMEEALHEPIPQILGSRVFQGLRRNDKQF